MTEEPRDVHGHRAYGSRGVGALIPAIARPAFRKRGPAVAQIMADWASIVGPELAANTAPRRLTGGRLAIACAGPVAMELQHLAPQLMARINAHIGQALVTELRFIQDFLPTDATLESSSALSCPAVSSQASAAVEKKLAKLPDGPLRDALAALGQSIHAARQIPARKR
ncbi:MAG: DUF721 domain-containing protein [Acetobacteraceae bacterium]|nr:DUF721 domain-containing protein [Acetobacteraceae bacterium]